MYNEDWVRKRISAIIAFYGAEFFRNKKVLDIGAGHGEFAIALANLGAHVTCVDARKQHLDRIRAKNHTIRCIQTDIEHEWPFSGEYFDLILHLGTLNHLNNVESHLSNVLISSNYLVLDTQVCDSSNQKHVPLVKENKLNIFHSYSGIGSKPATGLIEYLFNKNGLIYERISSPICNSKDYFYDWLPKNSGNIRQGMSRLWFARRYAIRETTPTLETHRGPEVFPEHPLIAERQHTPHQPDRKPTITTCDVPLPANPPSPPLERPPTISCEREHRELTKEEQYFLHTPKTSTRDEVPIRLFVYDPDRKLRSDIDNDKVSVVVLDSKGPPTFRSFFDKINEVTGPDDINIVCCSNIVFDESISFVHNINHRELYALTCWDGEPGNRKFRDMPDSQNTWIVRGKIENVNGDFEVDKRCADNRIAYEFHKTGYHVFNPCKSIRTYRDRHVPDNLSAPVPGPHLFVFASSFE